MSIFNKQRNAGSKTSTALRHTNPNTDLCVDLKTLLFSDRIARVGKTYYGLFSHDGIDHYSFTETAIPSCNRRNKRVFVGKHITVTRRADGTLRLNFRPVGIGRGFDIPAYANDVANEILWALTSLLGK